MLLIGSRAARYHWPDAREPKPDYDFIARWSDVEAFQTDPNNNVQVYRQAFICKVNIRDHECDIFDVDAKPGAWEGVALTNDTAFLAHDDVFPEGFHVADKYVLFVIKRNLIKSNLTKEYWLKCFDDYLFMITKDPQPPAWWTDELEREAEDIFTMRGGMTHADTIKKMFGDHQFFDEHFGSKPIFEQMSELREAFRYICKHSGTSDAKTNLYYLICGIVPDQYKQLAIEYYEEFQGNF